MHKNILLLNGSTRIKGNSLTICKSIEKSILDKGKSVEIESIQQHLNNKSIGILEDKIQKADVIGIVSPLYVDGFPYPVIAFLEEIQKRYSGILKGKKLFLVGQCNFPQSSRITPMVLSCQCFAKEVGMQFLGAMAYGGSVIRIEGKTLEEAGKEGARMIKALDMSIEDILNGRDISEKAKKLFKNDINKWLLRPFVGVANIMFRQSKKETMDVK